MIFQVDVREARTTIGASFDPQNDTIALNGSFRPGGWQPGGGLADTQALDDGTTGGDTNANDGIYTVQLVVPQGTPPRIEYKYGINVVNSEAAQGVNHVQYIRHTESYVLPVDVFGNMSQESATLEIGSLVINRTAGNVTLTWEGLPGVHLQKLETITGSATDVTGTEGQNSYEILPNDAAGFYRLVRP